MIKSYVGFLDDCEELPKGYLSLIDVNEKLDLGDAWWNSANIKNNLPEEISHLENPAKDIFQDLLNVFCYTKEDKKDYFNSYLKIAEILYRG